VIATLAMAAWLPVTALLFAALPARVAAAAGLLFGWMFLPWTGIDLPGLPQLDKGVLASVSVLLCSLAFSPRVWSGLRVRTADVAILVWCLCPIASSLTNGLGFYDGLSAASGHVMQWMLPYLVGRLFFTTASSCRVILSVFVVAALAYVPLCLYEVRMSPQIHRLVYGFQVGNWGGTRLGGWRPRVFMATGLSLCMLMMAGSLLSIWLWRRCGQRALLGIRMAVIVPVLTGTFILCKGVGAMGLFLVGAVFMAVYKPKGTARVLIVLAAAVPLYWGARLIGQWEGEPITTVTSAVFGDEKAGSFTFRLRHEGILAERALERPLFGWGGWDRHRVPEHETEGTVVTDGFWIIVLGQRGFVGLVSVTAVLLAPVWYAFRRLPAYGVDGPSEAAVVGLTVVLVLVSIDNLVNAMYNPMWPCIAGSLTGILAGLRRGVGVPAGPRPAAIAGETGAVIR
jgi:O-antigen ligase